MNYFFIGLDLSLSGTGMVILDENEKILEKKLISTKPVDVIEKRLIFIQTEILSCLTKYMVGVDFSIVFIEGLSFGSSGQRMLELAGLHYLVRTTFFNMVSPMFRYEIVSPTVIKKFITGTGNAKKELMLLKVYKKFGEEFQDNNICDAFCLGKLAAFRNKNKEVGEK
jgi:crossover junction endodeoxyribonuclease RuvC